MTANPHTSTAPNWVARLGETAVPLATTAALFAAVAAWGILNLPADGLAAIGETEPLEALLLGAMTAAVVAPVVLAVHALLARRWSTRRAWTALAALGGLVAPTVALVDSIATAPGQVGTLGLGVLGQVAMLYGVAVALTALALAGPALGVWLRGRDLPTDRRVWLAGAVVLAVLFAAPYGVAAMVDGGESADAFDAGDDWNGTVGADDEQGWNDTNDSGAETNSTEPNSDGGESDVWRATTLGNVTCADASAGLPSVPNATALDAPNASVTHYPAGAYADDHAFVIDGAALPAGAVGASAVGTNDSAASAVLDDRGHLNVQVAGGEHARVWIDVATGDGVERSVVDVCPPEE